ncbi:glycosyltransferase [Mycetohabitans sp. B5]|uniref:GT2 family glycosyltransferase n=1 Tax=Mycetohabitans endofungorum TaxID=417203 RepID=A0A2P5K8G8_9BURK|nr:MULTISPECIES: glycosyltransferase [Mycetohabitans]MCG1053589.1 glycosyltransferase [Mycetohabitans sp. B5]PPB83019.1 GT2 family glycosyltransferase [Mycetohabitans endofungorum]
MTPAPDTASPIIASVVVPTYRRPDLLARCLDALCAQVFDPSTFEILVVDDDRARHSAKDVVHAFAQRSSGKPRVRYIPAWRTRGPAGARNAGWCSAQGAIIAFTDDDTIADPMWLREGCDALARNPMACAVAGRIEVPLGDAPTDYERDASGLAHAEFATANCFVRRDALVRVGGFDERFTRAWREDADLMFVLREQVGPIIDAPQARVLHPVRAAHWGVSIGQQSKVFFDALLYKKHRRVYRQHIRRVPPWHYYIAVAALFSAAVLLGAGQRVAGSVALVVWAAVTTWFCWRRLRGTSRAASHIAEMIVTSIAIPPVSLYWRLRGALHFKVLFL